MQACNDKDVWDLELCKNINLLREAEKIILYGAGGKGQEILGWLQDAGIRVDEFWDIDGDASGTFISWKGNQLCGRRTFDRNGSYAGLCKKERLSDSTGQQNF